MKFIPPYILYSLLAFTSFVMAEIFLKTDRVFFSVISFAVCTGFIMLAFLDLDDRRKR